MRPGLRGDGLSSRSGRPLLLACMHRAAHLGVDGPEGNRLIWLYDIHLLASALSPAQWSEFAAHCAAKRMRRISADAAAAALNSLLRESPCIMISPPRSVRPSAPSYANRRAVVRAGRAS